MQKSLGSRLKFSRRFSRGQGLLEYALIILFVALVVFGALLVLGPHVSSSLSGVLPAL